MRRATVLIAFAAVVAVAAPVASAAMTVRFTTVLKDQQPMSGGFLLQEDVLRHGRSVGEGSAVCRFYPPGAAQPTGGICKTIVILPGGTLRLSGRVPFDAPGGHLNVIGGTGRFAGASGDGTYRALSTTRSAVTLHIR